MRVASEARQVPSEKLQTLWRDNLTGFYKTSADPNEQARASRAERRNVCAYANSVSFQRTGYGILKIRCERRGLPIDGVRVEADGTLRGTFAPDVNRLSPERSRYWDRDRLSVADEATQSAVKLQ